MPCFHPHFCIDRGDGTLHWLDSRFDNVESPDVLRLPCGKCVGCRMMNSQQWMIRCSHEAQLHEFNCFVTLTYSDEHLPGYGNLCHSDFQKFMKRLRKRFSDVSIRYFMCGEYGETLQRPHYHACLFGIDFHDRLLWSSSPSGEDLYESETLTSLWGKGHASVAPFSSQTAGYVARYSLKKVGSSDDFSRLSILDTETGELIRREPEYIRMSLKPGIGAGWYERFSSDVFPQDEIVHQGSKFKVPRYYDKLLARSGRRSLLDDLKSKRIAAAAEQLSDNTVLRLGVKEEVFKARISTLKRSI